MISWSAYHASHQALPPTENDVSLTSMLPLFREAANSVAMIRHSMNMVKNAVEVRAVESHLFGVRLPDVFTPGRKNLTLS